MLSRGFTLIEVMISLAVLGLVIMIGLPNLTAWLQNTQIRTAAEAVHAGLQLARAEALKRNATVRFQLVSTLTSACALSTTGKNWVVSLADAAGRCDEPESDAGAQIIQKRSGGEGSPNARVVATGGNSVWFNGLGRVVQLPAAPAAPLTQIDIDNPTNGACKTTAGNEPMRCLRIVVGTGGQIRMCDPAVDPADVTDPRRC